MLFVEPNCVPDFKFSCINTRRVNQYLINKFTAVYEVVLTVIDCEKRRKITSKFKNNDFSSVDNLVAT
jgi:hypothetical protein